MILQKEDIAGWKLWQAFLNSLDFALDVDGDPGKKTIAATKNFQRANSLKADGVVGDNTIAAATAKGFKGFGGAVAVEIVEPVVAGTRLGLSKITPFILQRIAPHTPALLRDRFLPYLNEALPRYGIINELQVAAFLATAAFESMYFQKTKEGKARFWTKVWRKYQSKYWFTNYMGRGIFQTTSLANYRKFGEKMLRKGLVTNSEIFVQQPELLEQPKWAVESACEFWETNGLDRYARQGLKGFSALQGAVNRGNPNKVALGYPDRLVVYEAARLALPDDFQLGA